MKTTNKFSTMITSAMIVLSLSLNSGISRAQNYQAAAGIKIGGYQAYTSLNFKVFVSKHISLEGLVGKNSSTVTLNIPSQVFVEYNNTIGQSNFSWYVGCGPTFGYWVKGNFVSKRSTDADSHFWGGLSTIVGLEHRIGNSPLTLSMDAGPSMKIYPHVSTALMVNFSLRCVFGRNHFSGHQVIGRKAYSKNRR